MNAEGRALKPGTPKIIRDDDLRQQSNGWPRPAREIHDELVQLSRDACRSGDLPDPNKIDQLADELAWLAAVVLVHGGTAIAIEEYERATRETAELARLTRQRVAA